MGREDVLVWGEIALFLVPITAVLGLLFCMLWFFHLPEQVFLRSGRNVLIRREIASVLVPIAVLSALYFTLWQQGHNFGDREGMSYLYFLMLALTGTGVCAIVFHIINYFEKLFFTSKNFSIKIALISGFLLGVAAIFYQFFYNLFWAVKFQEAEPILLLLGIITIILFLIYFVRFPPKRTLYEVCLRVLFPLLFGSILLIFNALYNIAEINTTLVLYSALLAYFFARPFVDHIVWTRPAVAPFVG